MLFFRILLILIAVWTNVSGWLVIYHQDWNLFAVLTNNLSTLSWNHQFNADLLGYLFFSALWIAWRHKFKGAFILFGLIVGFLGNAFMAPYLLFLTYKENGDISKILLGERR